MLAIWIALQGLAQCEVINISTVSPSVTSAYDVCPCLPKDICPRIYGTSPEVCTYII